MRVRTTLKWNGAGVSKAINKAAKEAVDETNITAANVAKTLVRVDTGALRDDIRHVPARVIGTIVQGSFGAYTVPYAIFQEIGTVKMAAQPYIRPASQIEYPKLAGRIQRRLRG